MLARIDSRRNRVRRVADIKSSPSFTRMIGNGKKRQLCRRFSVGSPDANHSMVWNDAI
jgi:hypothetical protein